MSGVSTIDVNLKPAPVIGPRAEVLDAIVRHASRRLGGLASFVSVVGSGRPYLRSEVGLPGPMAVRNEMPLLDSLSLLVSGRLEPMVVADSATDDPMQDPVAGELLLRLEIQSALGHSLRNEDGDVLGCLCVIGDGPREWTGADVELLADLSNLAASEIEVGNGRIAEAVDLDLTHVEARIEAALATAGEGSGPLSTVLECLCTAMGWDVGSAWIEQNGSGRLGCAAHWHRPSLGLESFAEICEELSFAPEEEMPGSCWAIGDAIGPAELADLREFKRAGLAEVTALRLGAWIPLGTGSDCFGALELLRAEPFESAPETAELSALGHRLGELLESHGLRSRGGAHRLFAGLPATVVW